MFFELSILTVLFVPKNLCTSPVYLSVKCNYNVCTVQARCEELQVQPRGTRGESGGQTGTDSLNFGIALS